MGLTRRACLAALLATGVVPPAVAQDKKPDARVYIKQTTAGLLIGGTFGGGVMFFLGRQYKFRFSGITMGGLGGAKVRARGEVYDMTYIDHFPGTYFVLSEGYAVGKAGAGDLWLKNGNGVVMRLVAEKEGIMLNLGTDTLFVEWD